MEKITGGCACGAVRFDLNAKPLFCYYCHCTDCQKNTGGPFSVDVIVAKEALSLSGVLNRYTTSSSTNDEVLRKFCAKCGSPILNEPSSHPNIIALKASSLDDASWLKPEAHIWVSSKQTWLNLNGDLPQYAMDM